VIIVEGVVYVVDGRIVYENVLGKPVRKNLLERPR